MKVGTLEETITVTGESPIVDTQGITQRIVMTRDVLDVLPTGRNIQAVGIMIPGTALALGGGGALSRDVGGSGNLQQSPLQYRGSGDTVQTIEGLRLNNLCAQGAIQRRLLERRAASRKSATSPAPIRPRWVRAGCASTWCRATAATRSTVRSSATSPARSFTSDNCGSPAFGQPCARREPHRQHHVQPEQPLTNVDVIQKIWDINPSIGGPIKRDKLWFYYTFRHWGTEKTKADSYLRRQSARPSSTSADTDSPGIDDGHIVSNAVRV